MRTQSNSLGLVAVLGSLGLGLMAPSFGCGDSGSSTSTGVSSSSSGSGSSSSGMMGPVCGNGVVEDVESCDDGNTVQGDGCENDCSFTCSNASPATGDEKCNDKDPCNGEETCAESHACVPGTPVADGKPCGAGLICKAGVCTAESCGDGLATGSEECDDGNIVNGDGCDACQFSCVSNDPKRDCAMNDVCVGQKCDDATHTCGPVIPDGQSCDAFAVCTSSVCVSTCGNGVVDGSEECDDGNVVNGDGCNSCIFSCKSPVADCPAAAACLMAICDAGHQCGTAADTAQNGMGCDPANPTWKCNNGACQAPGAVCGNGTVEMGEDCDFGASNGPGAGCEMTCKFSCAVNADCVDAETCNGTETCVNVTVNGKAGKKCQAGTNLVNCTACAGGFCGSGACKASTCGDTCIDLSVGEQCEPPNSATCDAMCKNIVVAVCGNGVRDGNEECDDNNTTNLDGCDSACKFEQVQRVNWLQMQFVTDMFCSVNALGGAINPLGQSSLQQSLTDGVANGTISILFKSMDLDDLTGTSDPMMGLGVLNADPVIPMGMMYDGTASLDWWLTVRATSLDGARNPIAVLPGSISAKVLTAGPGSMSIVINIGGSPAALKMSSSRVTVSVNGTTTPMVSATGNTPGHLLSENLDPTLVSFVSTGQPTANGAGKLCGNVSAASLAKVPAPASLIVGGANACVEGYTATNSLLDIMIGGCKVFGGLVTVINKTQPDQVDASLPPLGAGGLYTLYAGANRAVNECRDKNGVIAPLQECLDTAAYSSFFKLTTNRVIGK